jgi:hypothetical protein
MKRSDSGRHIDDADDPNALTKSFRNMSPPIQRTLTLPRKDEGGFFQLQEK